ncbi:MAG: FHA domain-containing protein [Pirellulaceae bacterium]|nr:FHA domain-containing protein [Planctomycetales bacterium]MCA9164238.1 FHA domain-containing protein [Planctomycetales bacterium]MCA9204805.1 FHA domain-containing protein [Planctomycetales bacterium]MCA9209241.1 FHA domain-containing protein [Planctomycetales bacterium]MCA9220708.1 FHA domain-containing protein [Planctomycetales bacterium]
MSKGLLVPLGGGDNIPLLKDRLLVGRRESCDIILRFANVSAHHCQLSLENGYWFVKDMNSRNGTKVNGLRITRKRIDPGDTLAIAKHQYEMQYSPVELGASGPPPADDEVVSEILKQSLLGRAGLERRDEKEPSRYNILDNRAGQIKDRNKPV